MKFRRVFFNVHKSPTHSFACACGSEIVAWVPSEQYFGVQSVNTDGLVCCSAFEGEFKKPGDGSFALEQARKQAEMSTAHGRRVSWEFFPRVVQLRSRVEALIEHCRKDPELDVDSYDGPVLEKAS